MAKVSKAEQSRRFKQAARELECDDDPKAFERVFDKIVPPKKEGDVAPAKPSAKPTKR